MKRQSITFTTPNDQWLTEQVERWLIFMEVNDLTRQARKQQVQIDWLRGKLEHAEKSGFTTESPEDILSIQVSIAWLNTA